MKKNKNFEFWKNFFNLELQVYPKAEVAELADAPS